jgi:ADP-heptose:LPS heptosyltransferase
VGEMHLRHVAALLVKCRLFVGHDTGLMHMAAAVGIPLVALFGPTSPDIYLPRHASSQALGGDDPCSRRRAVSFGPPECVMNGRCPEGMRSCIDQVRIGEVVAAVHRALAEGNSARPIPLHTGTRRGGAAVGRKQPWPT